MRRYLTEFLGTFFLVFTIDCTVIGGTAFAPLAIGVMLIAIVYMGGHVSGAHYNPAVSLAVMMRGKLESRQFLPYIVTQTLGSIVAALAAWGATGGTFAPAPAATAGAAQAVLVEFLFTFALALVVLNVATARATEGNSFYGLAIGLTVMAAAFAGGPISGGAFNPAVGIGPTLVHGLAGGGSLRHLWIYLAGPFAGGAAAAWVFKAQNPDE